jgi:hypothetical protein
MSLAPLVPVWLVLSPGETTPGTPAAGDGTDGAGENCGAGGREVVMIRAHTILVNVVAEF